MEEQNKEIEEAIEKLGQKPVKKKKFPVSVFILLMLIGFICMASYAVWVEGKYNDLVLDLDECTRTLVVQLPQEYLEEDKSVNCNLGVQGLENDTG